MMRQPMRRHCQIFVLRKRIKRNPQSEALRQRNLLLHTFRRMHFIADVFGGKIILHGLRHQVTTIGGRIDEQVVGERHEITIQRGLERLITGLVCVKREIVAIQDKALCAPLHQPDDIRQIDQPLLVDLDHTQALACIFI